MVLSKAVVAEQIGEVVVEHIVKNADVATIATDVPPPRIHLAIALGSVEPLFPAQIQVREVKSQVGEGHRRHECSSRKEKGALGKGR